MASKEEHVRIGGKTGGLHALLAVKGLKFKRMGLSKMAINTTISSYLKFGHNTFYSSCCHVKRAPIIG